MIAAKRCSTPTKKRPCLIVSAAARSEMAAMSGETCNCKAGTPEAGYPSLCFAIFTNANDLGCFQPTHKALGACRIHASLAQGYDMRKVNASMSIAINESPVMDRGTVRQRYRVLLVDDNRVYLAGMQRLLEEAGLEVVACQDGFEALSRIERTKVDVVVLDYRMPHLRGTDVAQRIRESGREWSGVPIVGLSVDDDYGLEQKCLKAGMNEFLTKLSSPDTIEETVLRWAKESRRDSSSRGASNDNDTA